MIPELISSTQVRTDDAAEGLRAVVELKHYAERLEYQYVEAALRQYMTWQEIADILGISRQAAHKKYAKRIDSTIPVPRRKK